MWLRRIMRRAMRHRELLGAGATHASAGLGAGARDGQAYPELVRAEKLIGKRCG